MNLYLKAEAMKKISDEANKYRYNTIELDSIHALILESAKKGNTNLTIDTKNTPEFESKELLDTLVNQGYMFELRIERRIDGDRELIIKW